MPLVVVPGCADEPTGTPRPFKQFRSQASFLVQALPAPATLKRRIRYEEALLIQALAGYDVYIVLGQKWQLPCSQDVKRIGRSFPCLL